MLRSFEQDVRKVTDAAVRGDLSVRVDTGAYQGTFAVLAEELNHMMEAQQAPLKQLLPYAENMANGVWQQDVKNVYHGVYAQLTDRLNDMRHALAAILTETKKMSEAGKAGDFSVRGKSDGLKGVYVETIQNFNEMLDDILHPLDEVGAVLRSAAKNDFTVHIAPEKYQGELKALATDVGAVLQTCTNIEKTYAALASGNIAQTLEAVRKRGKRSENDHITVLCAQAFSTIMQLIDESNKLAEAARVGDLTVRVDTNVFQGAYREIIEGLNGMMDAFAAPTHAVVTALTSLADGDLTHEITEHFEGQYDDIVQAINHTISSLNSIVQNISGSAQEVTAGSNQISEASQSLSQGSTEQASTVEELTSSLSEVAEKTKVNAMESTEAVGMAERQQEKVENCTRQMEQLLSAMTEIDTASSNISKIIKVIDDIAFQTNILALNAAVEAARAGQYGKGFAVVAEEVRSLAAKSASAAKDTNELIGSSIKKVQAGRELANRTAEILAQVSDSVKESAQKIATVGDASNEQSTAIMQISQGISQVSEVVQTNSATAEECAASSEELSGQSEALMLMVKRFRLKNEKVSVPA